MTLDEMNQGMNTTDESSQGEERLLRPDLPPSGTNATSAVTQTQQRLSRLEELLPGVGRDVTLLHIVPKLPWAALQALKSVSSSWQNALTGREVYDMRMLTHSTEPLVVIGTRSGWLELYSIRGNRCFQIPPVPEWSATSSELHLEHVIALDGRLYLLQSSRRTTGAELYVLDIAAHATSWAQCASMLQPRSRYGCGPLHGKIYVFGGELEGHRVSECEVYDPMTDTWSALVTLMPSWRFEYCVTARGHELFLYGGRLHDDDYDPAVQLVDVSRDALFLDVYNGVTAQWRKIESFGSQRTRLRYFVARGSSTP